MNKIIPFPAAPIHGLAHFPTIKPARWRREMKKCRSYHEALELVYRIIRDVEAADDEAMVQPIIGDQLVFPWAFQDSRPACPSSASTFLMTAS